MVPSTRFLRWHPGIGWLLVTRQEWIHAKTIYFSRAYGISWEQFRKFVERRLYQ